MLASKKNWEVVMRLDLYADYWKLKLGRTCVKQNLEKLFEKANLFYVTLAPFDHYLHHILRRPLDLQRSKLRIPYTI